jgi:hypothetical protein
LYPVTPVPESEIVIVGSFPLLVTVMLPRAGPGDAGANDTVMGTDAPGGTNVPFEIPVIENPGPAIVTLETVTLELLVLVNVTASAFAAPRLTSPKLRLDVLAFRPAIRFVMPECEALTVPLHPDWPILAKRTAARARQD